MKMDAIVDSMRTVMSQSLQQNLKQQGVELSVAKQTKLVTAIQSVMKKNTGSLMTQIGTLMDKTYSEQEVKDILAFYKTPTGQKSIAVMPQVMSESQVIAAKWVQTIAPQLDKEIQHILQ